MVVLFLVFWGPSILFSIVAVPIYIPTSSVLGFPFSISSPTFICGPLDGSHSDRCEVISHFCFDWISVIISDVEHLFMCLLTLYEHSWWEKLQKNLFHTWWRGFRWCPLMIRNSVGIFEIFIFKVAVVALELEKVFVNSPKNSLNQTVWGGIIIEMAFRPFV